MDSFNCPSCGTAFIGKFCTSCGEKKLSHHDFTIPHFIEESIEGLTHFDNKFFRSVPLLLHKPGALTSNFEGGRRVHFMKPMQLFIICNLLYFLLVAGTNIFSVSLLNYLSHKDLQRHFIEKFGTNLDVVLQTQVFAEKMINQSKAFVILFIPFFALAGALFFLKKKKPFGLQLVFATHFFTFLLLFFTLFRIFIELPNKYLLHLSNDIFNPIASTFNFLVLVTYFAFAAHRFYQSNRLWSITTGILAGVIFMALLQGYRIFLFYNILRTMK